MSPLNRLSPRIDDTSIFDEVKCGTHKVYLLHGLSGAGKTALTNTVSSNLAATRTFAVTVKHVCASAHPIAGSLLDWIVQDIAQKLLPPAALVGGRAGLEQQIMNFCASRRALIVIDNVELVPREWLVDFVKRWIASTEKSLLFLVATRDVLSGLNHSFVRKRQLFGLAKEETEIVLRILGDQLEQRFGSATLITMSEKLLRMPQHLLYLRWLDPKDRTALDDVVARIADGRFSIDDLWSATNEIAHDLVHFFALGLTNRLEIENELLSFLWDALGRGGAEKYHRVLAFLLQQGFLARIAGHEGKYALHPSLHIKLEKLLERTMGNEHIAHVAYYLSAYFRRRMCEGGKVDIEAMHQFAVHAIRAKNAITAAAQVSNKALAEIAHRQGLSLGYKDVLALVISALDAQHFGKQPNAEVLLSLVRLKIEFARCECALSHYPSCLTVLDELKEQLPTSPSAEEDTLYIRGIAEGCLGNSNLSIDAYGRLVQLSIEGGFVTALAAECIGYLALVECFSDPDKAICLSAEAMRFAREHQNRHLLAVSLCSTGQVMLYAGRREEAHARLEEAAQILNSATPDVYDLRELGRLLVVQGMQHLANGEVESAEPSLTRALEINERIGDIRRLRRAQMLLAVCQWRRGDRTGATQGLEVAIKNFSALDDKFYGAAASLAHAYILGARSTHDALTRRDGSELGNLMNLEKFDRVMLDRVWDSIIQLIMASEPTQIAPS